MAGDMEQRLFHLFANLLEYPRPGLAEAARECQALLSLESPEAAVLLQEFSAFVEETPAGQLEEIYTGTFDLDAACYPYVGYHLFGESYKRSIFLLELKKHYQAEGLDTGSELPDHLAVLLRFLANNCQAGLVDEIIHEALLPALAKMAGENSEEDREQRHEYRLLLKALTLVLRQCQVPAEFPSPAVLGGQGAIEGGASDA